MPTSQHAAPLRISSTGGVLHTVEYKADLATCRECAEKRGAGDSVRGALGGQRAGQDGTHP
jgi:hypothetical protein